MKSDNVAIIAAGVAFFTMLAIFPLITACMSIYGYIADTSLVQSQLSTVEDLLPDAAWDILFSQVTAVAETPNSELGIRIALGLLIALWSAGAGIRAIMRAMNIAYDELEDRGLMRFYGLAGTFTLTITVFFWLALTVIIGVPSVLAFLHLEGVAAAVTQYLPWILLISLFWVSTTALYLYGPARRPAKLRWVMPGAIMATLSWDLISLSFSWFVGAFSSFNKTYGSLSAVVVLLIWFWLTSFVVIAGAQLNAAFERRTQVDTTRGPDRPIGERGAAVADKEFILHPETD